MELRHLRYFVAVAEERHFGRAAERLHIAQPPLSQQIRRFEAELGEPLFYRTTRSVELAPAGEALLERAPAILAAVDAAVEDARRAARGEYGRLAIGFTGSSTYAMLPSLAAAMRDELPGVVLDLQGEQLTPAQVARLLDGTLDLGLLRPPVHERELATEVLHSEPLLAVLPEAHPLANAEAVRSSGSRESCSSPIHRTSGRSCTTPSRTPARPTASSPSPRTRWRRPRRS